MNSVIRLKALSAYICVNKVNRACAKVGALGYLWLMLGFIPVSAHAQETITIAVASSLYPMAQQQAKAFETEHGITVRLVSGSTGRLYNQIMQGAPFDAFIAADQQRPALLEKQGKVVSHLQVGRAYLGVKIGMKVQADPALLLDSSIRHIAIANPDVAPFGQVSKQVLEEKGLWQLLKPKMVYAQNAMQASMMVNRGVVDAGFIPVSSVQPHIASIQYHAVSLIDKKAVNQWLENMVLRYKSSDQQLVMR